MARTKPKAPPQPPSPEEILRWRPAWKRTYIGFQIEMFHGTGKARMQRENDREFRWYSPDAYAVKMGHKKLCPMFKTDAELMKHILGTNSGYVIQGRRDSLMKKRERDMKRQEKEARRRR